MCETLSSKPIYILQVIPEGEGIERASGSLFKKIVAENFVTRGKKQIADPESLGNIKEDESKETHIIKLPKIKDKNRTLKAAGEKQVIIVRENPQFSKLQVRME